MLRLQGVHYVDMERAWDKGVGQGDGDRHGEPEEGVARGAAHEEACPHPSSARSRLRQAVELLLPP